jgi:hypothetical protein
VPAGDKVSVPSREYPAPGLAEDYNGKFMIWFGNGDRVGLL